MARFYIDPKTLGVEVHGSLSSDPEEALEESIAKWQLIVDTYNAGTSGLIFCGGTKTCALCQLHYYKEDCTSCPVYKVTGNANCGSTPYTLHTHYYHRSDVEGAARAAKQELEFLKSLRQKEEE